MICGAREWRLSPAPQGEGYHGEKVLLKDPSQKVYFLPGLEIGTPQFQVWDRNQSENSPEFPKALGTYKINPREAASEYPAGRRGVPGEVLWGIQTGAAYSSPFKTKYITTLPSPPKGPCLLGGPPTSSHWQKLRERNFPQVQKWVSEQVKPLRSHHLEDTRELRS